MGNWFLRFGVYVLRKKSGGRYMTLVVLIGYFIIINIIAFALYGIDKAKAEKERFDAAVDKASALRRIFLSE